MKKFLIKNVSGNTEVYSGAGCFNKLPEILKNEKLNSAFVIVDANVNKYHGKEIRKIIKKIDSTSSFYILLQGEKSKSFSELKKIYSFLADNHCRKDSFVFAIGGGVTGDIAGYSASTYMRGINLVHIPTTLLSMVDSSIGGKTAINFEKVKNLVGTIYQPKYVITDQGFLKTLPQKEIVSGIGEIIKYGFLVSQKFYLLLNNEIPKIIGNNLSLIEEIILHCSRYKSSVVQMDEKDFGIRKILNLGHTFAHSIESELNYKLSHGESVMFGLKCMLCLSKQCGLLNQKKFNEYFRFLSQIKTNKKIFGIDETKLLDRMRFDKKNDSMGVSFVLMKSIGEIVLNYHVNRKEIISAIKSAKQLSIDYNRQTD